MILPLLPATLTVAKDTPAVPQTQLVLYSVCVCQGVIKGKVGLPETIYMVGIQQH